MNDRKKLLLYSSIAIAFVMFAFYIVRYLSTPTISASDFKDDPKQYFKIETLVDKTSAQLDQALFRRLKAYLDTLIYNENIFKAIKVKSFELEILKRITGKKDRQFVSSCYQKNDQEKSYLLKESLTDKERAKLNKILKKNQFKKTIDLMAPAIVNELGGEEKALTLLSRVMANNLVIDVQVGDYQIFSESGTDKMSASINIKTLSKVKIQQYYLFEKIEDFKVLSHLLAISFDRGKSWFFLHPSKQAEKYLKKEFPKTFSKLSFKKGLSFIKDDDGTWKYFTP